LVVVRGAGDTLRSGDFSAGPEGQFWSLESPLSEGYAQRYGLPQASAQFDFVETGAGWSELGDGQHEGPLRERRRKGSYRRVSAPRREAAPLALEAKAIRHESP
jgi:hypothetical protein